MIGGNCGWQAEGGSRDFGQLSVNVLSQKDMAAGHEHDLTRQWSVLYWNPEHARGTGRSVPAGHKRAHISPLSLSRRAISESCARERGNDESRGPVCAAEGLPSKAVNVKRPSAQPECSKVAGPLPGT